MIFVIYALVAAAVTTLSIKAADYVELIDKKTSLSGAFIGGILRLIAVQPEGCVAEVTVPGLKAARIVDLAEQTVSECAVVDGKVRLSMGTNQTAALRLITR